MSEVIAELLSTQTSLELKSLSAFLNVTREQYGGW